MFQPQLKKKWVNEKQGVKVIQLDQNQIPQSEASEMGVLGSILFMPNVLLTVSAILAPEDFYMVRHAYIYRAMLLLLEEGIAIDNVTLGKKLQDNGQLEEIGHQPYISLLTETVPTHTHVLSYARIVKEMSIRRRALVAGDQIRAAAASMDVPIGECLEHMEKAMMTVTADKFNSTSQTLETIVNDYLDNVEAIAEGRKRPGIPTGFTDLDRELGGAHPGDLTIIGGLSGVGKTTILLNMALNPIELLGAADCRAGFFTMEMNAEQLLQRMIASRAGLSVVKLREFDLNEEEKRKFYEAAGFFYKMPIVINDRASLTPDILRSEIRRMMYEQKVRIVFIDGLWLMSGDGRFQNRTEEINSIAREIKEIAREFAIPIYITHQVNKSVSQRQDKRPTKDDLEYGGHKDADRVYLIHRESVFDETTPENQAELIVGKNRHGRALQTYPLHYDGPGMTFSNAYVKRVNLNSEDDNDVPF